MGTLQTALGTLDTLNRDELLHLRAVIDTLLTEGLLDPDAGKGHIEYKFVERNGKRFGPYKHRRIWKNGKLTDEYLGRVSMDEYQSAQDAASVAQRGE